MQTVYFDRRIDLYLTPVLLGRLQYRRKVYIAVYGSAAHLKMFFSLSPVGVVCVLICVHLFQLLSGSLMLIVVVSTAVRCYRHCHASALLVMLIGILLTTAECLRRSPLWGGNVVKTCCLHTIQ